ncbi:unnamed protein product [Allacma fusca]|uniref:C2H2-type domain-containing protein n=1 Tax=Allacma fusca TaxID=39272 RepID=A0A8J2KL31_9HEXA|nr:unnamed protein product [Allacma fusca]
MVEISPNQFMYANKFYAEKDGDLFRCCSCGFTTKLRHSLTKHLYHKHLDERKHMCDTCGKNFQMMCQLRTHQMRVHKGDKFYKKMIHVCDICGKLFGSKTEWSWHTEEHKDVNDVGVPCDICGKHVYRHKMRMHVRSHEKMFECKDCNKHFSSKWYLSVHLKTHGGVKPYACEICGTKFAQKSSIRKHKIKLHDQIGEDTE